MERVAVYQQSQLKGAHLETLKSWAVSLCGTTNNPSSRGYTLRPIIDEGQPDLLSANNPSSGGYTLRQTIKAATVHTQGGAP